MALESLHGRETQLRPIVGVWLLVMTPDMKLFVVENHKAKYLSQKVPGQLNCPAESFEPADTTLRGTIERAIKEEIGSLDYDPSKISPLGLNKLNVPDTQVTVTAAPFLIPIENPDCLSFHPQDIAEASNPQWLHFREVMANETISIGPYTVPRFRTPMLENVEMLLAFQEKGLMQARHSRTEPIHRNVYNYLEGNSRTYSVPK